MVNYHEVDPTAPGNATLETHEIRAVVQGDTARVTSIGHKHGAYCTLYALCVMMGGWPTWGLAQMNSRDSQS